jgi:predicted PurR-regulated permease PerM
LAVTLGGSVWGITGAFLAVPVAATVAEVFRYVNERITEATRPGEPPAPPEGPDGTVDEALGAA